MPFLHSNFQKKLFRTVATAINHSPITGLIISCLFIVAVSASSKYKSMNKKVKLSLKMMSSRTPVQSNVLGMFSLVSERLSLSSVYSFYLLILFFI